jgi:Mg2+ and Co2+ transporter CorA
MIESNLDRTIILYSVKNKLYTKLYSSEIDFVIQMLDKKSFKDEYFLLVNGIQDEKFLHDLFVYIDRDRENIWEKYKRITNTKTDYLLSVGKSVTFINLNFLRVEKFMNKIPDSKLSLRICKDPCRIFIIKNYLYVCIFDKDMVEYRVRDILQNRFQFKFEPDHNQFMHLNSRSIRTTKQTLIQLKEKRGSAESAQLIRRNSFSKFDEYEMLGDNTQTTKNLIKKIIIENCVDEDSDEDGSDQETYDNHVELVFSKEGEFEIVKFYYWIFNCSIEEMSKMDEDLNEECEQLQENCIDLKSFERKSFFSKIIQLEESILNCKQELNIKEDFFADLLEKMNSNSKFVTKLSSLFMYEELSILRFEKKLKLYLEQLAGKMRQSELVLKNLQMSKKMLKQTLKIFADVSFREYDHRVDRISLYTLVISTIVQVMSSVYTYFGMNVNNPLRAIKHEVPFVLIVVFLILAGLSQVLVLKTTKWV